MLVSVALFSLPLLATAQLVPTSPGPGDIFKQGTPCTMKWTADTSGKWKQTYIELMTGNNQEMVHLTTVATVDGTDPTKTTFSFPCPAVSPNAAIYFYQFTATQTTNVTWTSRFAISDTSGSTTPPPNPNQPDGQPIPWGTGKLLGPSQGSPPPPTAPAGQIDGSGSSGGTQSNSTGNFSTSLPSSTISSLILPSSSVTSDSPSTVLTVVTVPGTTTSAKPSGTTANNSSAVSLYSPSVLTASFVVFFLAAAGLFW